MPGSPTKLVKLGAGTADPVTQFLRFVEFDPNVQKQLNDVRATAGTFYTDTNLIREVRRRVEPTGTFEPTATELAFILAWLFGPGTGTPLVTYTPASDIPVRNVHWFPSVGDVFFLNSVGIDNATFTANVGEPLSVALDMVGLGYDETHTSFPGITPDVVTSPFVLSDLTAVGGAFTFAGSTRQPNGFTLRVRNFIDRERYLNSLTLTRNQKMDARYEVTFEVPSGENSTLWSAGMSAVSLLATFVNAGASLSFSLPAIKFPGQSPRHARGGEGMVAIDGMGLRTGGTGHPLTVTLNPGP